MTITKSHKNRTLTKVSNKRIKEINILNFQNFNILKNLTNRKLSFKKKKNRQEIILFRTEQTIHNIVRHISDSLDVSDQQTKSLYIITFWKWTSWMCFWRGKKKKRNATKHSCRCISYKYLLLWIWINFDAMEYQIHTYFTT